MQPWCDNSAPVENDASCVGGDAAAQRHPRLTCPSAKPAAAKLAARPRRSSPSATLCAARRRQDTPDQARRRTPHPVSGLPAPRWAHGHAGQARLPAAEPAPGRAGGPPANQAPGSQTLPTSGAQCVATAQDLTKAGLAPSGHATPPRSLPARNAGGGAKSPATSRSSCGSLCTETGGSPPTHHDRHIPPDADTSHVPPSGSPRTLGSPSAVSGRPRPAAPCTPGHLRPQKW